MIKFLLEPVAVMSRSIGGLHAWPCNIQNGSNQTPFWVVFFVPMYD